MVEPDEVMSFWLDEIGPSGWYLEDEGLDAGIRDRFGAAWAEAMEGGYGVWQTSASGILAYLILTDQFPRNMFRGKATAFASDHLARCASKMAIDRGWDKQIDEPQRQFFYLPLMHSENLADQDRCVRLIKERMTSENNLLHAKAHREVIRQFGRFPYRNEALERRSTKDEAAYMDQGGYGHTLRVFQAAE